jgi:hypothetical protein
MIAGTLFALVYIKVINLAAIFAALPAADPCVAY